MKNIHIIPTDKPSRLGLNNKVLDYAPLFGFELFDKNKNFRHNPVNIYITSDEEIRRGDYFISLNGDESYLDIILNNEVDDFNEYADVDWIENCKKIIITDNKDLIKDGVQAIDDEFLEWFVKNPSCEEVEIKVLRCPIEGSYTIDLRKLIPKEEPKDVVLGYKTSLDAQMLDKIGLEEPKQETLEEAAEIELGRLAMQNSKRFASKSEVDYTLGFIQGAKWQAERMYSDAECYKTLHNLMQDITLQGLIIMDDIDLKKWFKQNKKK